MAVAIRGTTPAINITAGNPISVTLSGTRQPVTGDQLLIICCDDFYSLTNIQVPTTSGGTITTPTAISGASADGGTNNAHAKAYICDVTTGGADVTVTQTETGTTDEDKGIVVYVLSGSNGVDVAAGASTSGAAVTNHVAPSVSPTTSDAFLICHENSGGGSSAPSYTPPSGMTETYDSQVGGMSMTGAVLQLSASGATGTKTFVTAGSVQGCELTIAIKTAATGSSPALPEAGSSAEATAVAAAVPLAEAASAAEALARTISVAPAEAGSGAEALSIAAAVSLAEAGAGAEVGTAGVAIAEPEAGSGAEALSVAVAVSLTQAASAAEAPSVAAAVSLAQAASAAEVLGIGVSGAEGGAAADTLGLVVAAPLAQAASAAEALGIVVTLALAEAAAAAETIAAAPAVLGLAGNAHGPLPIAAGAVIVHTGTIAGAVT